MAATWDDLVLAGQPRLINYEFETTAGVGWKFIVGPFANASGEVVADLALAEFECKVIYADGEDVVTWTVTGDAEGFLTGTKGAADTDVTPGQHYWYCVGTLTGEEPVQFWGPGTLSPFTIHEGA